MIDTPRRVAGSLLALVALASAGCAVGGGAAAVAPPAPATPAAHTLVAHCGGCYDVPRPTAMSQRAWLDGLARMRRRVHLPEEEWNSLAALARADSLASEFPRVEK